MTKYAFRWIFDFERLEAWLNKMAAHGWMMQSYVAGFFRFSKGEPGEYVYRVELLPHFAAAAKNQAYLQFAEETGAELVGLWVNWAIFRKKTCEGDFEIYTDTALRMAHYRRVSRFLLLFCACEWYLALMAGGNLIYNWLSGGLSAHPLYLCDVLISLFAVIIGALIFKAAWRARKKYKRLKKEKALFE